MVMVDKEKAKVRNAKAGEKEKSEGGSGVEGNDDATPTPKAKPTPKSKGGKVGRLHLTHCLMLFDADLLLKRKTDSDNGPAEEKPKATKKTKKVKDEKAAAGSEVKLESDTDQE